MLTHTLRYQHIHWDANTYCDIHMKRNLEIYYLPYCFCFCCLMIADYAWNSELVTTSEAFCLDLCTVTYMDMSEVSTVLQEGCPPPPPAHSLAVGDWQPIVSALTSCVSLQYYILPSLLPVLLSDTLSPCMFSPLLFLPCTHTPSLDPIVSVIPRPLVGWATLSTSAHCPSLFALKFVLVSRQCLLPPLFSRAVSVSKNKNKNNKRV